MDWRLLGFTLLAFAISGYGGRAEYHRLQRQWPESGINRWHRHPGWARWLLLLLLLLLGSSLYFVLNRRGLWHIPDWLDLSLLYWCNGSGALLFGLLLGLGWGAWKQEHHPNGRALVLTALLCQVVLLLSTAMNQRLVADQLSNEPGGGQILRQTSGYSCAAASGANVAGLFGLKFSEKEMARLMGTRVSGTSPVSILRGMRAAGLEGSMFEIRPVRLEQIPLPAILVVDHRLAGSESHAVAAVSFDPTAKTIEIWDPLTGKFLLTEAELAKIWPGRGLAFKRRRP